MKSMTNAGQAEREDDRGLWKSTIAAASHAIGAASNALGAASRVQQAVSQTLRLQHKIRALRDELHKAEAERDVYRELHARTVEELHRAVDRSPAEQKRLQSENESLRIRHRAFKLLVQHYARTGQPIDATVFTRQRRQVQQHLLFQRRRGMPIEDIGVADIAFLLR